MIQVEGLLGPLYALDFREGRLWAVGDYGLILCADVASGIEKKNQTVWSTTLRLYQNYPNPFNPKTVISYQLPIQRPDGPVTSHIDLSIYNLLGQRIATLVSAKQPAGNYKVEWDATRFPSGIYYYRLLTNREFAQTKKLIVLK